MDVDIATYDFATIFFTLLNSIKMFHWQTQKYGAHQAADQLHTALSQLVDKFMEVAQGKAGKRIKALHMAKSKEEPTMKVYVRAFSPPNDSSDFSDFLTKNIQFLMGNLEGLGVSSASTELLNIRDEMVAEMERTKYLLTFK